MDRKTIITVITCRKRWAGQYEQPHDGQGSATVNAATAAAAAPWPLRWGRRVHGPVTGSPPAASSPTGGSGQLRGRPGPTRLARPQETSASQPLVSVVVVHHVTIVAIDMGCWRHFGLFGNMLRSTHCREFLYVKLCRPAYFVRTTQLLPHPGHE